MPETAAHHIVAGVAPAAQTARDILDHFGIDINSAANGVFLPASSKSPNPTGAAVHSTLHTGEYYTTVNNMLSQATSAEDAIAILQAIASDLKSGGL